MAPDLPTLLVGSWQDGLFVVAGGRVAHELAGEPVRSLAPDGRGGVLVVGPHALRRRSAGGGWSHLATSEAPLACCMAVGDTLLLGTDDARILRLDGDGSLVPLAGFDAVPGRESWYAGAALIDGKLIGPPLGLRTMTATCDSRILLANVHVGGIPRSADFGLSWQPTINIDPDVHQVCAHPERPGLVVAAAAAGLCISRDGGASWTIEQAGLHAPYCSAVAVGRAEIFVAAATDHFASEGAIYRRPIDGDGRLQRLSGGMPEWIGGIADTGCIATRGSAVAVADRSGRLYLSLDDGHSWSIPADGLPAPCGLQIG